LKLGERAEVATGYSFSVKGGDKLQSTAEDIVKLQDIKEIKTGKGEKANN
jgi:hypothetical protein